MSRNKPRLQLALYARPKYPGTYHYALLISPKSSKRQPPTSATKYHVKNTLQNVDGEVSQPWRYERATVPDVHLEQRLLARIVIAKVSTPDMIEKALEAVPIYQVDDPDQELAQSFNCVAWVRAAVGALRDKGLVSGLAEWDEIQKKAFEYVEGKMKARRWEAGWEGMVGVPMLDLLSGREMVQ